MAGISAEQVKLAKEVDLLTYLQTNEPQELRKSAANEYRTETHSSLVISNGLWFYNRGNVGGRSAVDFLIKVRGMGFLDAVETVLGGRGAVAISVPSAPSALPVRGAEKPPPIAKPKAEFKLPEAAPFPKNVVAYLQKRGIAPEIISRCLTEGFLYESRKYQNAVFVGKDENGKPRFACQRGTKDDFKADVTGSDKRWSFNLPANNPESRTLFVFEAPVDLLSHMSLQQRMKQQQDPPRQDGQSFGGHLLSLGGTSDVALIAYLERNPQIKRVVLHLDNDEAGLTAAQKIKERLGEDSRFKRIRVSINPPRGAKDYNELLLQTISKEREQSSNPTRRKADFSL